MNFSIFSSCLKAFSLFCTAEKNLWFVFHIECKIFVLYVILKTHCIHLSVEKLTAASLTLSNMHNKPTATSIYAIILTKFRMWFLAVVARHNFQQWDNTLSTGRSKSNAGLASNQNADNNFRTSGNTNYFITSVKSVNNLVLCLCAFAANRIAKLCLRFKVSCVSIRSNNMHFPVYLSTQSSVL